MSSSDYITNINTTYTDSDGNQLIWSDNILYVLYYDSSASVDSDWKTDWAIPNPFMESSFTNPVNVDNVWSFATDSTDTPPTCSLGLCASWNSTDLLVDKTVTSSGYHFPYGASSLVDFYENDGWETVDASGDGTYAATVDIGSSVDLNYVSFIPGFGDSSHSAKAVKNYRIGIATTDDENAFVIVASGTTTSGSYDPISVPIGSQTARYVKFYVDSNWGDSSYSRVGKISAYNNPDWSLFGYNNYNNDSSPGKGTNVRVSQSVNLTNIDHIFVDAKAYMTNAYQVGELKVYVNSDAVLEYDWSNTGTDWQDSRDNDWWTRIEESIDISSYNGTKTVSLRMFASSYGREAFMGYFDNIAVSPLWYREGFSSKRGSTKYFPDELYVVSDAAGVSLIEKDTMKLWMRFDVGDGYMLTSPAKHVYAYQGVLYLSTSFGLHVIDFNNNRCLKFTSSGVFYRMSIGRRNERAFWFTDDDSFTLPSNDILWSSVINIGGTDTLVIGHGEGTYTITSWLSTGSRTGYESAYEYPTSSIHPIPCSGISDEVVMKAGHDTKAFVMAFDDPSDLVSSSFEAGAPLYADGGEQSGCNIFNSDAWTIHSDNVPISIENNIVTFSGVRTDYGPSFMWQSLPSSNKGFSASVDVKINDWPTRGEGGFHFGVGTSWPWQDVHYGVARRVSSIAAINGINGLYVENESFSSFPSYDNWTLTIKNNSYTKVYADGGSVRMYGYMLDTDIADYAPGIMFGHKYPYLSSSFTAKIKVKCTEMHAPTSSTRQMGVVFGITDGQYIPVNNDENALFVSLYSDVDDASPPVYCLAYSTTENYINWDISSQKSLFSSDLTSNADWHTWEFTYNASTKTITAAVDGDSVGTHTLSSMYGEVGIVFGIVGNDDGYIDVRFKDFEIDFGANQGGAHSKYIAQLMTGARTSRPTVSGTMLDGIDFDATDGTPSSSWRTWSFDYTPPYFKAYIDSVFVGSQSMDIDNGADVRLFLGCDIPTLVSGSDEDRTFDISVKDFIITYDADIVPISGSINAVMADEGTYLANSYNSLYVSTSNGASVLSYASSATISGSPDRQSTYTTGSSGTAVLYGNVDNVSSMGPESGYAAEGGLLYVATSISDYSYWEKLIYREGNTGSTNVGVSIGTDAINNRLYIYYFDSSGPFLYVKGNTSKPAGWAVVGAGDYPDGFSDSPHVQSHRSYLLDLLDGNMYYCGDRCFGILKSNGKWLYGEDNIATGGVSSYFVEQVVTPAIAPRMIWIVDGPAVSALSPEVDDWYSTMLNADGAPWSQSDTSCVYSELDNSLYVLVTSDSSFYKISLDTFTISSALDSCPYTALSSSVTSMFYRPYDASIYALIGMDGSAVIVRYDVKSGNWVDFIGTVPAETSDFVTASYSVLEDAIYIVTGIEDTFMYRYKFGGKKDGHFVSWNSGSAVFPNELDDPYRQISLVGDVGFFSDDFLSSSIDYRWYNHSSWANASISPTTSGLHMELPYSTGISPRHIMLNTSIPVELSDFSLEADVRITDMASSVGGGADIHNLVLMGITGYKGAASFSSDVDIGASVSTMDSLYMVAMNDSSVTSNRYSMYTVGGGSSTYYNSSDYVSFYPTDSTSDAQFRTWKIEYDHSAREITTYIDSVSIGTASLDSDSFTHGALLSLGLWSDGLAVSGTTTVDVRNLVVTPSSSSSFVSDYLDISSPDDYDYCYYEKYDSTLISGSGFIYEASARFTDISTVDNYYAGTIGEIQDGFVMCSLVALNTTPKTVGLYLGGDFSDYTSYIREELDWTIEHSYKMEHCGDYINVYVDDADNPLITNPYSVLPSSFERKVLFGNNSLPHTTYFDTFSRDTSMVVTSGTWTRSYSIEGLRYGAGITTTDGSGNTKVICDLSISGDSNIYMFYDTYTNNSTDIPVSIYHNGEVDVPTYNGYAGNAISSSNSVDEYGNTSATATTLCVDGTRCADGNLYSEYNEGKAHIPSGWLYLGKYSDVDRIVVTTSGTSTDYVTPGTFKAECVGGARVRGNFRFYEVKYATSSGSYYNRWDAQSGFSIIDRNGPVLIDSYSTNTSPNIIGDDVTGMDII